ncbi:MAG: hypothetical protein IIV99_04750 [Oscillospiraceae bacterium]|jgi:hypothetical protein|nr:hypothetical protein [Oscillospiraceae bacterium]
MIFFAGFVFGAVAGCGIFQWFYTVKCAASEVQTASEEKDRQLQKQLERLISYGNDL